MIRAIKCRDWLDDEASPALFAEYAAECANPELGPISPQRDLYDIFEANGMQSFGAYSRESLVGFATPLIYRVPHYGVKVASAESIFIANEFRRSTLGADLIKAVKDHAKTQGCVAVIWSAPVYSRFSALLMATKGCRHSNNVFIEAL